MPRKNRRLLAGPVLILLFAFVGSGLAAEPLAPGFGRGGVSETPLPLEDRQLIFELGQGPVVADLAVAPGGGLVAAVGSGTENEFFGAARFGAGGGLDKRFGNGGFVRAGVFPSLVRHNEPQAEGVAVQGDGKVVLVGSRRGIASGTPAPVVMRVLPDGRPDRSFGQRGLIAPRPNGARADALHAVSIQPGGRIVAVGVRNERDREAAQPRRPAGLVVAYRRDGRIDRSFGAGGRVFFHGPKARYAYTGLLDLAILPNRKVMVVGYRNDRLLIARLSADGELDRSFGEGDGTVSIGLERGKLCCPEEASLATFGDGGAVVLTDGLGSVLMARLRPDGGLDKRFGHRGILRSSPHRPLLMRDVAVAGDGGIVAVGQSKGTFAILRFRSNGRWDRSFARKGFMTLPRGRASVATSATRLPDGQVVVGGGARYRQNDRFEYELLLARLR